MWSRRKILVTLVTGIMLWPTCAAQDGCYTAGGVAGIVIATIIVTLIFGGLTAAVARYLWKHRAAPYKGGEKVTLPETCLPEKQPIGPKTDYAFDNPYFKDDDGGDQGATPDAAEKGEAGFASDRGDNDNSQNSKSNSGSKSRKHKPFANIPFYSVFGQGYKKPKSMDDTYISKQSERISVPLRGHDFTGLGFNICGNMRDGIFIKDVLHRGPASESGKIKAGDRIISVTVSFGSIVYEDALTILSYASPYDVKLEIEEGGEKNVLLATSSPGKRLASASFRNGGQRLFHPLYRSQSIDDLTQIGKESFLLQSKSTGSSSSYKRSQSIQAPASKTRPQLKLSESAPDTKALNSSKRSRESSSSSESSLSNKISTETLENSSSEELTEKREVLNNIKSCLVKDSLLKLANVSLVTDEKDICDSTSSEPLVQENMQKKEVSDVFESIKHSREIARVQQANLEESLLDLQMPKAPPRKQNTPGKRKAPSPPKLQHNPTATEISAVVHQADESMEYHLNGSPTISGRFLTSGDTGSNESSGQGGKTPDNLVKITSENLHEENLEKTQNSTSTSGASLNSSGEVSEPPSPKRKASSLGDLTKLNESRNKNASSSILERAVSLDLQQQQSVPESNLERQKKILKPPAFNPEDTSEENFENVRDQEMLTKDWEIGDPWSKLPVSVVDNSDCELVTSQGTSVFSPSKKSLDSTSITNGHHHIFTEGCSKLDDTSTACSNIKGDCSPPVLSLSASISAHNENEYPNITSTPARKVVEFDNIFEGRSPIESSTKEKDENNEDSLEEKSKHASGTSDNNVSEKTCSFSRNTHTLSVPVSLSIPIIPPVIHHYEKLSISPSSISQGQKDILENSRQDSEEKDIPSLYKPLFLTKHLKTTNTVLTMSLSPGTEPKTTKQSDETQESWISREKDSALASSSSVNGDEAELSSVGQYRTAVEFPTVSDNTVFITSKLCNTPSSLGSSTTDAVNKYSSPEISETSIHGKDISHAKKGTASGSSGEDTPRLNSGSNSPPPQLEPPQ